MKKLRNLLMIAMSCALLSTGFMSCDREVPEEPETPAEQTTDTTDTTKDNPDSTNKDADKDQKKTDKTTDKTTTDTTDTSTDTTNNDTNTDNNNNTNPAATSLTANSTLQAQITNAQAGGSITLTAGTTCTNTYINVNKALTIDGNNLENLTVYVAPTISSNVTIKKLKNAKIIVGNVPGAGRSALAARAADGDSSSQADTASTGFSKVTDNALPLHIEDCTIEKLDAETDVALYLEKGSDKKSEIEEVNLLEGAKDFSIIEFDENGKEVADKEATPTADKSVIGKLNIEDDGIEKINLIGGVISDVDFADGVTAEDVESLKYDKEFADQLGDAAKTDLLDVLPDAKKEDVGVAEIAASQQQFYKLSISRENIKAMNGYLTVVFMKDSQVSQLAAHYSNPTWLDGEVSKSIATTAEPVYMMIPAGQFMIDDIESATGLKTIYGAEYAYVDYARAIARGCEVGYENEDIVVLDKYRNYNKEAVIVDCGSTIHGDVEILINMAAIKKSDVVLCCGEYDSNGQPIQTEAGTKLSIINLDGYKPYIALDYSSHLLLGVEPPDNQETFVDRMPDNVAAQYTELTTPENFADLPDDLKSQIEAYYSTETNGIPVPERVSDLAGGGENTPLFWVFDYYESINGPRREAKETILGSDSFKMSSPASIYGSAIKLLYEMDLRLFPMHTADSYKDVSSVAYTEKATPTDKTTHPLVSE